MSSKQNGGSDVVGAIGMCGAKIFAAGKGGETPMTRTLISELAQRLGKSEEEIIQFFQTLWQVIPPSPELQPYFFRYLDERFLRLEDRYASLRQEMQLQFEALRTEMHQQIDGLRKEMQQGNAALQQQIETLRTEMHQQISGLRKEIQQGDAALQQQIDSLREEMHQQVEGLRSEMNQRFEALQKEMEQRIEALQKETDQRFEAMQKEMEQRFEMLRKEMQHGDSLLRQEIEALRHHVERVEKWLFALTIPVLVSTLGILVMLFKPS